MKQELKALERIRKEREELLKIVADIRDKSSLEYQYRLGQLNGLWTAIQILEDLG